MAECRLGVTITPRWIVRQGIIGALVSVLAMKLGAPFKWFYRLEVTHG